MHYSASVGPNRRAALNPAARDVVYRLSVCRQPSKSARKRHRRSPVQNGLCASPVTIRDRACPSDLPWSGRNDFAKNDPSRFRPFSRHREPLSRVSRKRVYIKLDAWPRRLHLLGPMGERRHALVCQPWQQQGRRVKAPA
jgi:hypothetical protein